MQFCTLIRRPTLTSVVTYLWRTPIGQWAVSLGCHVLVTVSDRGDNKGQWATHSLIKWLTSTTSILSWVILILLNFLCDIVKSFFFIVTKFQRDMMSQCSVTAHRVKICNFGMSKQWPSLYFHLHVWALFTAMPWCVEERMLLAWAAACMQVSSGLAFTDQTPYCCGHVTHIATWSLVAHHDYIPIKECCDTPCVELISVCIVFYILFWQWNRVLRMLAGAADNCLTGNFGLTRPHWNNMVWLSWHTKYPNPLQMYGWVICFEINCTWKQMSHWVMFDYSCCSEI